MAAASADRKVDRQPSELASYNGASGYLYYKGTLLMKDATNAAVLRPLTAAGASNGYFLGVVADRVDLTAGLGSSQKTLEVWKRGEFTFAANGTGASADIGKLAFALDDQTVGVSIAQPTLVVGEIMGIPTTSTYRVRIDSFVGSRGISILNN